MKAFNQLESGEKQLIDFIGIDIDSTYEYSIGVILDPKYEEFLVG